MAVKDRNKSVDEKTTGKLLSPEERKACEQISGGEAPFSQRALALMAIDEGATQAAAGERAGLTSGQVKYWLAKFRKEGVAIFPEASPVEPETEPTAPEVAAGETLTVAAKQEEKPKAKKVAKVEKKGKKAKKPKKKTKAKKGKSKGTKKSKKGKAAASTSKKKSKKKKKK